MNALCEDFLAECGALRALTAPLDEAGWGTPTTFFQWSVYDEVAHLCLFDEIAVMAARSRAEFDAEKASLDATLAAGTEISEVARRRYAHLQGPALAAFWSTCHRALAERLSALDPKARLPWFGPDMSARSFVTARLMETWAHGQDAFDALHAEHPVGTRLKHIAHLGVITFGWSFANRGMTPPGPAPYVELTGPGGARWSWGEVSALSSVRGSAQDFCLVVTQRRHHLDTHLEVAGPVAEEWMRVAQCFAGPPVMGPSPGTFPR